MSQRGLFTNELKIYLGPIRPSDQTYSFRLGFHRHMHQITKASASSRKPLGEQAICRFKPYVSMFTLAKLASIATASGFEGRMGYHHTGNEINCILGGLH